MRGLGLVDADPGGARHGLPSSSSSSGSCASRSRQSSGSMWSITSSTVTAPSSLSRSSTRAGDQVVGREVPRDRGEAGLRSDRLEAGVQHGRDQGRGGLAQQALEVPTPRNFARTGCPGVGARRTPARPGRGRGPRSGSGPGPRRRWRPAAAAPARWSSCRPRWSRRRRAVAAGPRPPRARPPAAPPPARAAARRAGRPRRRDISSRMSAARATPSPVRISTRSSSGTPGGRRPVGRHRGCVRPPAAAWSAGPAGRRLARSAGRSVSIVAMSESTPCSSSGPPIRRPSTPCSSRDGLAAAAEAPGSLATCSFVIRQSRLRSTSTRVDDGPRLADSCRVYPAVEQSADHQRLTGRCWKRRRSSRAWEQAGTWPGSCW